MMFLAVNFEILEMMLSVVFSWIMLIDRFHLFSSFDTLNDRQQKQRVYTIFEWKIFFSENSSSAEYTEIIGTGRTRRELGRGGPT
jgi:hypothetical protein